MKAVTLGTLVILKISILSYPIYAGIRCDNDIISIGDTSSEVMLKVSKCGKMLNKEIVRKKTIVNADEKNVGEKVKKERVTEVWYIRVKEREGMYCYPLSFEEGRLRSIGRWSRCD